MPHDAWQRTQTLQFSSHSYLHPMDPSEIVPDCARSVSRTTWADKSYSAERIPSAHRAPNPRAHSYEISTNEEQLPGPNIETSCDLGHENSLPVTSPFGSANLLQF